MDVFVISFVITGALVPVLLHYLWPDFMEEIFVDPPPPPYRLKSCEFESDIILKSTLADMGGINGPRTPQLVLRSRVGMMRRKGFEVVLTEDGRECIYLEPADGKKHRLKILMAKKEKIECRM